LNPAQQVPRNALVWSVIALFALVAPHLGRIPVWVIGVYLFAVVWRSMVYRGRWSFPGRLVKLALIVTSFISLYLSYGTFLGLEPTVALLLIAFALKLIELVERKDAYVLLFLGYFVCVTEFLFSQDLLIVVYSTFTVLLITTALLALHQPQQHKFNPRTIRLAGIMLLQAFPLMLVLFFLFPRIGPLWTVPIKSQAAKTGVSDFMRPGDISKLSQSSEVAFRVQFEGAIPNASQLYWRGLVFSKLEDGAWSSLDYFEVPATERRQKKPEPVGDEIRYDIIMEPTQQGWLYGLRHAEKTQSKVMGTADFRLYSPVVLEDEYKYTVSSWPDAVLEPQISQWRREIELEIPKESNPETIALAKQLRLQYENDRDLVNAILKKFNEENYVYTLQPPLLGEHAMDEFLFQTRRGFCEHYAYAFTLLVRAAGIPARVIAGYQGGEVNPVNKTVIVHQFDAHAWTEVWLKGEGWVRVDPTAAVSPDRIEWGLERAVAAEGSFLSGSPLSLLSYRSVIWVNNLRLRYEALTWQWQSWIVGYDAETQYAVLQNWFGEISARKFAIVLLGSWALVLIPVGVWLLAKRPVKSLSQLDKVYLAYCDKLRKQGLERTMGETPGDYAVRAKQAFPVSASEIDHINALYSQLAYQSPATETATVLLREFKAASQRLKVRVKKRSEL
jgi:transglutaminase-like putative cysteine protease